MQLLNVDKPIPNLVQWGRFWVRIFCDNNKTECSHCGRTDHPYFKCPKKEERVKKCFRCLESGHMSWQCQNEIVCNICHQQGHVQKNCGQEKFELKTKDTKTSDEKNQYDLTDEEISASPVFEKSVDKTVTNPKLHDGNQPEISMVILGASLVNYIDIEHPNVEVKSKSGATINDVESLINLTETKNFGDDIKQVVIHLGTNDVSQHYEDAGQVMINYSIGLSAVKSTYPNADIHVCSIPPRRGKSEHIKMLNNTAMTVNRYLQKLPNIDTSLHYVDTYSLFMDKGVPIKRLYDLRDSKGVHVNNEGKAVLKTAFTEALGITEAIVDTKRKRGDATPSSAEKAGKRTCAED